jgi:hypothetical protein
LKTDPSALAACIESPRRPFQDETSIVWRGNAVVPR